MTLYISIPSSAMTQWIKWVQRYHTTWWPSSLYMLWMRIASSTSQMMCGMQVNEAHSRQADNHDDIELHDEPIFQSFFILIVLWRVFSTSCFIHVSVVSICITRAAMMFAVTVTAFTMNYFILASSWQRWIEDKM